MKFLSNLIITVNAILFGGTGANDYKFKQEYNSTEDSLDWIYNG